MGNHHSKSTPSEPSAPWAPLTNSGAVTRLQVSTNTLYGKSGNNELYSHPIASGTWSDSGDGGVDWFAVDGVYFYSIGADGNVYSARASGSGTWRKLAVGTGLSSITVLNENIYVVKSGKVATVSTSGGVLTTVPGASTTITEVCACNGDMYGIDGTSVYKLTKPMRGPWVKRATAPSEAGTISCLTSNSNRLFVVGSDSYVYGTC